MAQRLKTAGFDVVSFAPIPAATEPDPTGLEWRDSTDFNPAEFQVVINYRDPKVFEAEKPAGAKWWFVAQDVDYPWTPEALAKVDRYLCLCKEHARYTRRKYPELHNSGRLFISSNGILSDEIQAEIEGVERNPHRLMYASSPDRGLMLLLEQWFRIRERVPQAELHVFYGFHNMEKIVAANGPDDWRAGYQRKLEGLLKQPGVVWHDRVGQRELWKEWAKTSVFWYPTDFPETSPVHGDTLVETLTGKVPIKDLVGKEVLVYSCDSEGKLSISKANDIRCTRRDAETIRLYYIPGRGRNSNKVKTLRLTPDHEVMLRDGTYVPAGKLKVGDSVKAFHRQNNGWGDGYDAIGLTDQAVQPEHRFVFEKMNRKLRPGEVVDHLDANKRNNLPENLEAKNQATHAAEHYLRAPAEYREWMRKKFSTMVRETSREKKSRSAYKGWETKRKLSNHRIVKIEKDAPADVYCMNVVPDHNFIANDIVVHNCISIMEAQACGAIPVTSNFWAAGENCLSPYVYPGLPQQSAVVRQLHVERVVDLLRNSAFPKEMLRRAARERFNWSNVVVQWGKWIEEDLKGGFFAPDTPPDEWFQDSCSLPAGRFDKPAIPQEKDVTK